MHSVVLLYDMSSQVNAGALGVSTRIIIIIVQDYFHVNVIKIINIILYNTAMGQKVKISLSVLFPK